MSQVEPADVLEAVSWALRFLSFHLQSTKTKISTLKIGIYLLKYAVIPDTYTIPLIASELPVLSI